MRKRIKEGEKRRGKRMRETLQFHDLTISAPGLLINRYNINSSVTKETKMTGM